MSPASYRAAPPRVVKTNYTRLWPGGVKAGVRSTKPCHEPNRATAAARPESGPIRDGARPAQTGQFRPWRNQIWGQRHWPPTDEWLPANVKGRPGSLRDGL